MSVLAVPLETAMGFRVRAHDAIPAPPGVSDLDASDAELDVVAPYLILMDEKAPHR
jgi:hypothetical protein